MCTEYKPLRARLVVLLDFYSPLIYWLVLHYKYMPHMFRSQLFFLVRVPERAASLHLTFPLSPLLHLTFGLPLWLMVREELNILLNLPTDALIIGLDSSHLRKGYEVIGVHLFF